VRPADFERWAGYEVKIELKEAVSGRKRFRGPIEGFADGEARIEIEVPEAGRQIVGLPVGIISSAKLVLTDELVRDTLRRAKGSDTSAGKADKPARKADAKRIDVTK
jgi:ribosome maturation factor RimP